MKGNLAQRKMRDSSRNAPRQVPPRDPMRSLLKSTRISIIDIEARQRSKITMKITFHCCVITKLPHYTELYVCREIPLASCDRSQSALCAQALPALHSLFLSVSTRMFSFLALVLFLLVISSLVLEKGLPKWGRTGALSPLPHLGKE